MKLIGTSTNGNHLVEMTAPEFRAIQLLIQVADGKTLKDYQNDMYTAAPYEKDVATLMNAVMEWIEPVSRANELRHLADRIDMALKVPASEGTKNE